MGTPTATALPPVPTTAAPPLRRGPAVPAPARRPVAVSFPGPRSVGLVEEDVPVLLPGAVRVRTLYSGISAGTEMTAYRGSNVYLTKHWDPAQRLFAAGSRSVAHPGTGWGYNRGGLGVRGAAAAGGGMGGPPVGGGR